MSKRINLLDGNIFASLTQLAIPIMLTSLIQMAYNMTDMIWIGKLGSGEVAAVGAAGMFMWLSNGLTTLARMGGQVKVAHSLGAGNHHEAAVYAKNSLQLCIVLALLYGSVMLIFTNQLIGFFKLTQAKVISNANIYLKIVGGGILFSFLNQVMTGIVTATGNSKTPFVVNTAGLILNIILDPLLIFGLGPIPAYGVGGAAVATVLAQALVFALYVLYAVNDDVMFYDVKIFTKPDSVYIKEIIRIGLPSALQSTLFTGFNMCLARLVASWGDVAIAVQKVGSQIESISWMAAEGFAAAVNSFVAQNYGANNYDRAKKGYFTALKVIGVWGVISTCILIFLPEQLFRIFIQEQEAVIYGIDYLIILGYSQLLMCVEIITAGAFSGFGKTVPPSVVSIVFTAIRIPMAMVLSSTALGLSGVWWSITISSNIKGIILLIAFVLFIKKSDKKRGLNK